MSLELASLVVFCSSEMVYTSPAGAVLIRLASVIGNESSGPLAKFEYGFVSSLDSFIGRLEPIGEECGTLTCQACLSCLAWSLFASSIFLFDNF